MIFLSLIYLFSNIKFCCDNIFQINGVDMDGARHDQAVSMLTGLERFVRMVVEREIAVPRTNKTGVPPRVVGTVPRVSSPVHRVSSPVHRVSSPVQRVSSPVQSVSSPTHRISSPVQKSPPRPAPRRTSSLEQQQPAVTQVLKICFYFFVMFLYLFYHEGSVFVSIP